RAEARGGRADLHLLAAELPALARIRDFSFFDARPLRRLRAFGALSLRPLSAIAALFARFLDALSLRYLSARRARGKRPRCCCRRRRAQRRRNNWRDNADEGR